jgi:catechol 2,3-dioxygenase-like lactoylglutathione lyase family enzyme
MHVIERTDAFTLVGVDARLGKLTLFAAQGPRDPGMLDSVVLRVHDMQQLIEQLPPELAVLEASDARARLQAPEGLVIGLVPARPGQVAYDLDHVVLRVPDAERSAQRLARMGFKLRDGRLEVGERHVRLETGPSRPADRPLLNHLALLVPSVDDYLATGAEPGLEVDELRDAPNTYAAFVWGPDRIKLEYLEHKPGFSLV